MLKKPLKLIVEFPGNKKRPLRFDISDLLVENEFEEIPFPSPFGGSRPTGRGTITAKFIKRGK